MAGFSCPGPTERYPFAFSSRGGQGGHTQVIWVALQIHVSRAGQGPITVRVVPQVRDAFPAAVPPA